MYIRGSVITLTSTLRFRSWPKNIYGRNIPNHISKMPLPATSPVSSESKSVITSTFFHSTPYLSKRRRNVQHGRFKGDAFFCDVNAWLDMEQLHAEFGNIFTEDKNIDNDNDWWMIELDAAPAYDAKLQPRDGRVSMGRRIIVRLAALCERIIIGGFTPVQTGLRIRTTDAALTFIRPVDANTVKQFRF